MKKLSVITINFNDGAGLKNTLDSITPIKKDNIELIVIDGGSKDNSLDIISEYQGQIDFWVSEPDRGIYHAMNKGIEKSSGMYVMFVNSGDTLMQSADFEHILKNVNDEDIVYHNLQIVQNKNKQIKTYPDKLDFKYFAEDTIPHTGTCIKKDLFIKYGKYSENYKIVSDWAFYMDCILLHKCSYKYVNDCFASFYIGGISSDPKSFNLLFQERDKHISEKYSIYYSLYEEWKQKKNELYRLKNAVSVKFLRKLGFLKWLID